MFQKYHRQGLSSLFEYCDRRPYADTTVVERWDAIRIAIGGVPNVRQAQLQALETYQEIGRIADEIGLECEVENRFGTAEAVLWVGGN